MKELKRDNNKYWKDYFRELKAAGITVEDEIDDVFEAIEDYSGEFYDEFRRRLAIVKDSIKGQKQIKEGRKTIVLNEYLVETLCMPANRMTNLERQYPIIQTPIGDGRYSVRRDIPEEARPEIRTLFWCHLELEIVNWRLLDFDENK